MQDFPLELRESVANYLSGQEILTLCSTSKEWEDICHDESFWRDLVRARHRVRDREGYSSWKELFFALESSTSSTIYLILIFSTEENLEELWIEGLEFLHDYLEGQPLQVDLNAETQVKVKGEETELIYPLLKRPLTPLRIDSLLRKYVKDINYSYEDVPDFIEASYSYSSL